MATDEHLRIVDPLRRALEAVEVDWVPGAQSEFQEVPNTLLNNYPTSCLVPLYLMNQ